MSKLIIAGNEIIPGTITVTANNSTITPKDDLRVILNISAVGAVTLSNGTDTTQRVEVFNVSSSACSITYRGSSGNVTCSLRNASGMTLLWTGTYWKATIAGLITGTDANGATLNYTSEATIDLHEEPVQYSTTEQDTGKTWIDGKPIYRKVFSVTPTHTTSTNYELYRYTLSNSGIAEIVNVGGWFSIIVYGITYRYSFANANMKNDPGNGSEFTSAIFVKESDQTFYIDIRCSNGWSCSTIKAVVEYTKST